MAGPSWRDVADPLKTFPLSVECAHRAQAVPDVWFSPLDHEPDGRLEADSSL